MTDRRDEDAAVRVGPYEYVRRDYTPKRRGQPAGHGWVRQEPRAQVGAEANILVDEVVRLRSALVAVAADIPGRMGHPLSALDHRECWERMKSTARAALASGRRPEHDCHPQCRGDQCPPRPGRPS